MSDATKCDLCDVLFERKPGDLSIVTLREACTPPKDSAGERGWCRDIIDEDEPLDMCSKCSDRLRDFLNMKAD